MSNVQTSKILVRIGSIVTLQCTCHKDVIQWYHDGNLTGNISLGTLALDIRTQFDNGIYSCIGQQHNVTHYISVTAYCKLSRDSRHCYY